MIKNRIFIFKINSNTFKGIQILNKFETSKIEIIRRGSEELRKYPKRNGKTEKSNKSKEFK